MKKILSFIFIALLIKFNTLYSQGNTIKVTVIDAQEEFNFKYKSTMKFIYKDGEKYSGKINLLNDSQFCFIDFFGDPNSIVFNIKDLSHVFLEYRNDDAVKKIRNKRFIPLGVILAVALPMPLLAVSFLIVNAIKPRHKVYKSEEIIEDYIPINKLKIEVVN